MILINDCEESSESELDPEEDITYLGFDEKEMAECDIEEFKCAEDERLASSQDYAPVKFKKQFKILLKKHQIKMPYP